MEAVELHKINISNQLENGKSKHKIDTIQEEENQSAAIDIVSNKNAIKQQSLGIDDADTGVKMQQQQNSTATDGNKINTNNNLDDVGAEDKNNFTRGKRNCGIS